MRATSFLTAGALVALLVGAPASAALAAAGTWSPPLSVSPAGLSAAQPDIVTSGDSLTAVWQAFDGTTSRIYSASSVDDGATWSSAVPLTSGTINSFFPRVITDGARLTAVWYSDDGSSSVIESAHSLDNGATWSTPVIISATGGFAYQPSVVTNGSTITATWEAQSGAVDEIEVASSSDGGITWSVPLVISASSLGASDPVLVTDGTTITVAWRALLFASSAIETAWSTDGGSTFSTPQTVSVPGLNAFLPQIATDGSVTTIAWHGTDGSRLRAQVASSSDGGVTYTAPTYLSAASMTAYRAQVVTDGSTITVVWEQSDPTDVLGLTQVLSAVSSDDGVTWSAPVAVSGPPGDVQNPMVASDGGVTTVVWNDQTSGARGVGSAMSLDAGVTWAGVQSITSTMSSVFGSRVVTDGTTITAIWRGATGADDLIYVSSYTTASPELAATGSTVSLTVMGSAALGAFVFAFVLVGVPRLLRQPERGA